MLGRFVDGRSRCEGVILEGKAGFFFGRWVGCNLSFWFWQRILIIR